MMTIRENTEFGLDMIRGLPHVYWCVKNDHPHTVRIKPKLKSLYELITTSDHIIPNREGDFIINNPPDIYVHDGPRWAQDNERYKWCPPPLKEMFKDKLKYDKPTIVINNKFSYDWEQPYCKEAIEKYNLSTDMEPVLVHPTLCRNNDVRHRLASVFHYSLPFLEKVIEMLSDKYQILYIRPIPNSKNFFEDHNPLHDPGDYELIHDKYPNVVTIQHVLESNPELDFTTAQFMMEATSEKHLTTSGGNCKVSAYFGGDVLIYQWEGWKKHHRKGGRAMFNTDSWLKKLSGANIIGIGNYNEIVEYIKNNWYEN